MVRSTNPSVAGPAFDSAARATTEPPYAARLRAVIAATEPVFLAMADAQTATRPAPGKWSPREIVGHLIDSASNNHQRFVRAAWRDDLIFPGYEQDRWVELQDYQNASWPDLVTLWASFNRHIARVMSRTPAAVRTRPRDKHNLHEIASRGVPPSEPATLEYFMSDYVFHLEHHVSQILGPSWQARLLK